MDNLSQKIIGSKSWTLEAKNLLNMINELSNDSLMIFIRHSERTNPIDPKEIEFSQLTNDGILASIEFGMLLPKNQKYRIFSSKAARCRDTASYIQEGLKKNNCSVQFGGPMEFLTNIEGKGIIDIMNKDKKHVIRKWASGQYPTSIIEPFTPYIKKSARIIWDLHQQSSEKIIDIFITHDLHLMAWQYGWSGFIQEEEWVEFLGGFIGILAPNTLTIYKNRNKIVIKDPPYYK